MEVAQPIWTLVCVSLPFEAGVLLLLRVRGVSGGLITHRSRLGEGHSQTQAGMGGGFRRATGEAVDNSKRLQGHRKRQFPPDPQGERPARGPGEGTVRRHSRPCGRGGQGRSKRNTSH